MKILVIGGGPAGLMAAKQAFLKGHDVCIVDSQEKLGKKLLMTGNTRCNITNNKELNEFMKQCSKSTRFLYSSLSEFGPKEIIEFFNEHNCPLVQEDYDRMFPQSQKATDILNVLLTESVKTELNTKVERLNIKDHTIESITTNKGELTADHYILATGGKSFPVSGSDGSGYKLLQSVGHTITDLVGIETGLHSINTRPLQGLSLKDVTIKVRVKNKVKTTEIGDVLFTHFGLSGPGILKISETVVEHLKHPVSITLSLQQVDLSTGSLTKKLKAIYPNRFVDELLKDYDEKPLEQTSNYDKEIIRTIYLNPTYKITGVQPIEKAFVTKGGVATKDIDPITMKSKLIHNLSICGEVLDCHGSVGGYNLTLALSSGYSAGRKI